MGRNSGGNKDSHAKPGHHSVSGFQTAEAVFSKALEDKKFRVGVTERENGEYWLVTTNAPLDGGGKQPIQQFHGLKDEVMRIAKALKAGKTLNYAYEHRYGK